MKGLIRNRTSYILVRDDPDSPEAHRARGIVNADGTVPHVQCEGARFHVKAWTSWGVRCSEPRCALNHGERSEA